MSAASKESPKELIETLLGHLGFVVELAESERGGHTVLEIRGGDARRLIGRDGKTLEELQYLVNRMLAGQEDAPPRVVLDIEGFRAQQESELVARVRERAKEVRQSGRPQPLEPMHAYDRWLVHQAFAQDPEIATRSEATSGKYKRIILEPRGKDAAAKIS